MAISPSEIKSGWAVQYLTQLTTMERLIDRRLRDGFESGYAVLTVRADDPEVMACLKPRKGSKKAPSQRVLFQELSDRYQDAGWSVSLTGLGQLARLEIRLRVSQTQR